MFLVRAAIFLILSSILSGCTFAISPLMLLLIKNEPCDYYEAPRIRSLPDDAVLPSQPVESNIAFDSDFTNFLKA